MNIVFTYKISHDENFTVVPYPDGTFDVHVKDDMGTTFYVRWRNKTLMIDLSENTTKESFGTLQSILETDDYEDVDLVIAKDEDHIEVWGVSS